MIDVKAVLLSFNVEELSSLGRLVWSHFNTCHGQLALILAAIISEGTSTFTSGWETTWRCCILLNTRGTTWLVKYAASIRR